MGSALPTVMPRAEQMLQDDDPDLLEVIGLTEEIRGKELLRAYKLREKMENSARDLHDDILQKWAAGTGRSVGAWKGDLKWAFAIDPDDLIGAFEAEGIGQGEWCQRVGTSHLGAIAKAKHQDTNLLLSSAERAQWAVRAYHANLSVDQLTQMLRDHDLLPPKKGLKTNPTQNLTACSILSEMAEALAKAGIDIDLGILPEKWEEPVKVSHILRKLALKFDNSDHQDATWAPKVETPKETGKEA